MMCCLKSKRWPWPKSCHLTADSLDELHAFARALRLKMRWFQDHSFLPHYDLTESKRGHAISAGAKQLTRAEAALRIRAARLAKQEPAK